MPTQPERPIETGTRSEQQQSSQSGSARDVPRSVPSTTEPSVSRTWHGGVPGPLRSSGFYSPWELMRNMSEEIDRLLEGLTGLRTTPFGLTTPRGTRGVSDLRALSPAWAPAVEVIEKPNALLLRADLPGLKPDEVHVNVEDGLLTISGERKQEHKEEREGYMRSERSYGAFYRAFALPESADDQKIAANFKNGVLEITVPVSVRERGRAIKIES